MRYKHAASFASCLADAGLLVFDGIETWRNSLRVVARTSHFS
jgi:hypothetical protein